MKCWKLGSGHGSMTKMREMRLAYDGRKANKVCNNKEVEESNKKGGNGRDNSIVKKLWSNEYNKW